MKLSPILLLAGMSYVYFAHPAAQEQTFDVINAEKINIREKDGTLKAVLSDSAGFKAMGGDRASSVKFSGLMFYNEEGQETGGLVYRGEAAPGGQDADVTLSMDQYRQDQVVYLNHSEKKDAGGLAISDGLQINSRPDWTRVQEEYATYGKLQKLPKAEQTEQLASAAREGRVSTGRLFVGVRRGVKDKKPYDDAGVFIRNRAGRVVIKLYVGVDDKPRFEVYDEQGKSKIYELKLDKS